MSEQDDVKIDGDNALHPDPENTIVLEHISSGRVLISIIILVILYVFSKWLVSQHEPNIRVDGNINIL